MNDKAHNRKFFASPWPFVVAAILFAVVTPNYLSLYGYGHWSVTQTAFILEVDSEKLTNEIIPKVTAVGTKNEIAQISERLKHHSDELKEAGGKIMGSGAAYHLTGLISLLFTAFAFACRPRWAGIISLPFGLYAMKYFFIIM
jgi:hypothetical protein